MRNLLSKLRDTMPLPLKNQGAVIFHWWTCQHWGKIPSTHTFPPPVATAAHIAVRLSWKRLWKKADYDHYHYKMAAVSKKRLERPLLVTLSTEVDLYKRNLSFGKFSLVLCPCQCLIYNIETTLRHASLRPHLAERSMSPLRVELRCSPEASQGAATTLSTPKSAPVHGWLTFMAKSHVCKCLQV